MEHLTQIAVETEAVPLRSSLSIPNIETAFGPDGEPADPLAEAKLGILLDDLAWWSTVLGQARATGELPPAVLRMRGHDRRIRSAACAAIPALYHGWPRLGDDGPMDRPRRPGSPTS